MMSNDPQQRHPPAATTTYTAGPRVKCDQVVFEALSRTSADPNNHHHHGHPTPPPPTGGIFGSTVANRGGFGTTHASSSSSTPSSSRFNLTLPENAALRSILQKYRRALHLPFRLDVYFQHEGDQRELLERWCLEYKNGDGSSFWTQQATLDDDPIVQLRQVCKKIVIWLRTLYCYARLLPSTGFLHAPPHALGGVVGFSLYAVPEGTDDVGQLQEQGFVHQGQPACPVTTPYGELRWQVLYAPRGTVERLLPQLGNNRVLVHPRSTTQAIPIKVPQQQQQQQQEPEEPRPRQEEIGKDLLDASNNAPNRGGFPQSAPEYFHLGRPKPATQEDPGRPVQNTYHPRFVRRATFHEDAAANSGSQTLSKGPLLQRSNSVRETHTSHVEAAAPGSSSKPPRVLSGLSLALMNETEKDSPATTTPENNNNDDDNQAVPQEMVTPEQAVDPKVQEKRRAALHQMPPHLQQPEPPKGESFGGATRQNSNEYGYAYNNHIPWQKILPSKSNPTYGRGPYEDYDGRNVGGVGVDGEAVPPLPPSPTFGAVPAPPLAPLATTPPSAFGLLAGGLPTVKTPPGVSLGMLLPPRNATAAIVNATATPPFAPRPLGFSQMRDPPTSLSMPPTHSAATATEKGYRIEQTRGRSNMTLSSLDMLHESPFQLGALQQQTQQQPLAGSMLSSLTLGGPPAVAAFAGSEPGSLFQSGDVRLWTAPVPAASFVNQEDAEEMPFAVDSEPSSELGVASQHDGHSLASSAAVTSFAQKCSMHQRLEMFEQKDGVAGKGKQEAGDDDLSQLASQLADFRSFGASLHVSSGDGDSAAATTPQVPISLRS